MSKGICFVLFGLFVSVSGFADASSTDETSAEPVDSGCDVTIRGVHGGASGTVELQLGESQVRNRVGWWATIGGGIITLETRERFSEVVSLDFDCNAHRRYRFYFEAYTDGTQYQYMYYFPNEDDFTQQTVIDLGDVSRFFDAIEPAPDLPSDEPLAGVVLDGEWIRRESNNDPNDGMRIEIVGQIATLTHVPTSAGSDWQVGNVLWQGISEAGEIEVRGSNGNYYAAQLAANGLNQLELDIDLNARGDEQTWVRGTRVLSADEDAPVYEEVEIEEACADLLQLDPVYAAIVDPVVEDLITEQELIGLAVGVIDGGVITHLKGYGYADWENREPVTTQTVFRWASVSKTLTGVAALSMWEDDELDLDADVNSDGFLTTTEFPRKQFGGNSVTLTMRDLLSMSAAVRQYAEMNTWLQNQNPPQPDVGTQFPKSTTYDPIAALGIFNAIPLLPLSNWRPPPAASLPAPFHYSTFSFMLAGAVLELAAADAYDYPTGDFGSAYEQLVYEHIAEPLCMTSLQTDFPGRNADETKRYLKDRNSVVTRSGADDFANDDDVSWRLPGGGYASNIRDLALFARALLTEDILEPATHDTFGNPVSTTPGRNYSYGLEFFEGNTRLGHAGDHASSRASMFYYPANNRGLVILVNSGQARRDRLRRAIEDALGWSPAGGAGSYTLTSSLDCSQNVQTGSDSRFAGVWQEGPTGQILRRGYTLGKFADERERLRTQGYHLTDLDTFESDGERLWDGVFTPEIAQTRLWRNYELEPFLQKVTDERAEDSWLVDVEVYTGSQGQHLWAGVFAQGEGRHYLEVGLNTAEFHDIWEQRSADGYRLVDIETYEATNGMRLWTGIFVEGSGGYGLFRNVPPEDFAARENDFARDGLRTIDVERYFGSQGQPLWALVGRPIDGNQTSRIDKTFCGTWNGPFTGFWETHEDLARQGRSLIDFERYPTPAD